MAEMNTNKKDGNNKNIGSWIFRGAVLVLMIVIAVLLLTQKMNSRPDEIPSGPEASVKAKLGQLENKTEEEIVAELNRVIEEGMFHIAINANPVFEDGKAEGNLRIENVPNNHYSMRVEIVLDETGQLIYDSGLIDPNYHVQKDSLLVDLDKGDYIATATFYAYDMDTLVEMGSVATGMTIHVVN